MAQATNHATVVGTPQPQRRYKTQSYRDHVSGYLYVLPFILIFLIFQLFPMIYAFYVSFFSWKAIGTREFIGIQNYLWLITDDPKFWKSVLNTFTLWIISTIPQLILALILASTLNRRLRMKQIWRLGVFIPNITSVAAITIVFGSIFSRDYGMVNYVLSWVGIEAIDWKNSYWAAQIAVASIVIWRWTGYNSIIYLAALQTIPKELYEAARIDGANKVQQFIHITIPMIRPVIIFTVIVSTIGGMQIFVEPLLFISGTAAYEGGSQNQVLTMVLYMFTNGFRDYNFGYASAVSWLVFIIVMIFAGINLMISRKINSAN